MKTVFYLAKKYVRFDSHTVLPVVAIAIGIAFLITVVSIIEGFDSELIKNLTSTGPDILIKGNFDSNSLKLLKDYKAFLYDRKQGIIYNPKNSSYSGVQINIFSKDYVKSLYHDSYKFMIGDALARKIMARSQDAIYLYVPNGLNISNISPDIYQIGKVFKTGIYQYDLFNVVISKDLAYAPYIFVKLRNPMKTPRVKIKIEKLFPFSQVYTWMDMNENIIKSLNLESIVVFLVILFTVILSGFGISNSLLQRVYERRKDMGILFSLGFSKRDFKRLVIIEAIMMWFIGAIIGVFLGLSLSMILRLVNITLPSNIYYVTNVPIVFNFFKIGEIVIFSFLVTFLSSLLPAIKASKQDPIELIRFE
jgi:lipoprotein-releasing system permease protein